MFLSSSTPLIAVDIGSHSIKLAQLGKLRKGYELLAFGTLPLQHESIVEGKVKNFDDVVETLTKLVKAENVKDKFAVASVAGEAVIIKKIKMPRLPQEALTEKIHGEAEQYIPFDIDDVSMDFQVLEADTKKEPAEAKDEVEVLLVAVQRETIDSHTDILTEAGLKPVIMDLDVLAMMNVANLSEDLEQIGVVALIDLGASFTHINIVSGGLTHFTRDFRFGGAQCTEKLMSDLDIPFAEAEALKQGRIPDDIKKETVSKIIVDSFEPIFEEIQKSLEGFEETEGRPVNQLLLSGGGALISGVNPLFERKLGLPVKTLNPLKTIKINRKKFSLDFIEEMAPLATVALGLAIRRFDYIK